MGKSDINSTIADREKPPNDGVRTVSRPHTTRPTVVERDSVNQMLDTCVNMDKCDDNECNSFVF